MKGSYRKRGCKCPKGKGQRCKCGATWSFRINGTNPKTGKRIQPEFTGYATLKEAESDCAKKIAELESGTLVIEKNILFKDFAESWLKFYATTGDVKPGTIKVRKVRINGINKHFGNMKIKDISRADYQEMLFDMFDKKSAHETILSAHATAKMIFRWAMEQEVIAKNPTEFSKIPKKVKTVIDIENNEDLPKFMEKEELVQFLEAAKKYGVDKDYAVFMTLAYSGMRIGELIVLRRTDIDYEQKSISITKTYENVNNNTAAYEIVPPKTVAGIRTIEIDKALIAVLKKQENAMKIHYMQTRDRHHDKGFFFPKQTEGFPGYPDTQKNIEARMKRILKLSGMSTEFTPHTLRHTHTTFLAEAGASLQEVMERLGHKDDKTTRLVYMHVTKTMKRGAAQKFSDFMRDVVKP